MINIIYFIQAGDYIKIGYTELDKLNQRLANLQCGNPWELELLGTVEGGYELEQHFHKLFAHLHTKGEWFHAKPELHQFIEAYAKLGKAFVPTHNAAKENAEIEEFIKRVGWKKVEKCIKKLSSARKHKHRYI